MGVLGSVAEVIGCAAREAAYVRSERGLIVAVLAGYVSPRPTASADGVNLEVV